MRNETEIYVEPTAVEIALKWLTRFTVAFAIFAAGTAVGAVEGMNWLAKEATARFDCVEKP